MYVRYNRLIKARFNFKYVKITIKHCYAAVTNQTTDEDKDTFYEVLYVCSPDYLKLGFRFTRRLEVRIIWPILAW